MPKDLQGYEVKVFAPAKGKIIGVGGVYTPAKTEILMIGSDIFISVDGINILYAQGTPIALRQGIEYIFSEQVDVHEM